MNIESARSGSPETTRPSTCVRRFSTANGNVADHSKRPSDLRVASLEPRGSRLDAAVLRVFSTDHASHFAGAAFETRNLVSTTVAAMLFKKTIKTVTDRKLLTSSRVSRHNHGGNDDKEEYSTTHTGSTLSYTKLTQSTPASQS